MGLPQEVVDRIMDILQDDESDLKACSLTCKAMFASTRHLIHQTLNLERENRLSLTPERKRRTRHVPYKLELRFLSFMGERDLLKYARHLNIRMDCMFSPYLLEPYLHHFRSLDRIHTLRILSYSAHLWIDDYNTYFTHFYPTLTTLALHFPAGDYRDVLRFALRFPNLENLTLDSILDGTSDTTGTSVPPLVSKSPPLRGRFRCATLLPGDPAWAKDLAFGLPGGINFRSVEFQGVYWGCGQPILDGCAGSLEEFIVRVGGDGERTRYLVSFVQPRLNAPFHISRAVRTG